MKLIVLMIAALLSLSSFGAKDEVASCIYGTYKSDKTYQFNIYYDNDSDRARAEGLPRRDNLEQRKTPVYGNMYLNPGYGGYGRDYIQLGSMEFVSDDYEFQFFLEEDWDGFGHFYGRMSLKDSLGKTHYFHMECSLDY